MLQYSIIHEDDDYVYCVLNDGSVKDNVKVLKEHFKQWCKGKVEK